MKKWAVRALAAVGTTSCALLLTTPPSLAAAPSAVPLKVVRTLSSSFVGPLQFGVAGDRVLVADSFSSTLTDLGRANPLATGPSPATGGDLAGVAVTAGLRSYAYTTSTGDHSSTKLTIRRYGSGPVVADLSGFEKKYNPDGAVHYGVDNPSACVTKELTAAMIPASYTGEVDSHPYAVAALDNGAWAVADAGGNDLLKVDRSGNVSVIAVLPRQPVVVSKALAVESGLSPTSCVVGVTYNFESVPTDVEVGPHGVLYVTTLPGGPEGPDSGNPGSVYRIDAGGQSTRIATGFGSATNLAIDPHGNIYVAELGAGRISEIVAGKPQTVLELPGVVAVEYANGQLYASTAPAAVGPFAPGRIVVLGPAS